MCSLVAAIHPRQTELSLNSHFSLNDVTLEEVDIDDATRGLEVKSWHVIEVNGGSYQIRLYMHA